MEEEAIVGVCGAGTRRRVLRMMLVEASRVVMRVEVEVRSGAWDQKAWYRILRHHSVITLMCKEQGIYDIYAYYTSKLLVIRVLE